MYITGFNRRYARNEPAFDTLGAMRPRQIARDCAKFDALQVRAGWRQMRLVRLRPAPAQAIDDLKQERRRGDSQASFAVRKTEDRPERLEWSPAGSEMKNYLRYAAAFEVRGHNVLIKISQHVELRRAHARELHRLAALVGEGAISSEMQKRVGEMIRTFLERAQTKLEGESAVEQEAIS